MSDNAKSCLNLHNLTVSEANALRSWGPFHFGGQGKEVGTVSQLKIRIETEEYIYEEYVEA